MGLRRLQPTPVGEGASLFAGLAKAGVTPGQIVSTSRFAGGTYNAVHQILLADGRRLVVKIPPDPARPALAYEQGILATEVAYYQLAAKCPGVAVPRVIAADADGREGGPYLVMTECPGVPWPELTPLPHGRERAELRAVLGRQVAALHEITGPGFGYPSLALGPLRGTWREAFADMVGAVLADAARFGVGLPRPAAEIGELFAAQAPVLDEVTRPVLVHFDLWDGNILVRPGPAGRQIGGLIDAERAFWGDPLAEFVSLALFGDIERDAAFLAGYRAAGGTATFDAAARRRLELYTAYLYLIMWVEAVPRRYDQRRLDWLRPRVFQPLTEILGNFSRG